MKKLTVKDKTRIAAIVVFKCIERELNTLRDKGNVTCPDDDDAVIDAIAANINGSRGQWRKTKPKGREAESLYYALRFRMGRTSTIHGIMMNAFDNGTHLSDAFDTIACLIVRNQKRISDMAKHALQKGN